MTSDSPCKTSRIFQPTKRAARGGGQQFTNWCNAVNQVADFFGVAANMRQIIRLEGEILLDSNTSDGLLGCVRITINSFLLS